MGGAERLIAPGERVAFVGDSITEFGADRPDGYVRLVEDGLRRSHCPIVVLAEGRQSDKSNQIAVLEINTTTSEVFELSPES